MKAPTDIPRYDGDEILAAANRGIDLANLVDLVFGRNTPTCKKFLDAMRTMRLTAARWIPIFYPITGYESASQAALLWNHAADEFGYTVIYDA